MRIIICFFDRQALYLQLSICFCYNIWIMNNKLKIAAIALLGFSTACCATRKCAFMGGDKESPSIVMDTLNARIKLMYGVRMPNGEAAVVLPDQETQAETSDNGSTK